jgi:hypothetical protein
VRWEKKGGRAVVAWAVAAWAAPHTFFFCLVFVLFFCFGCFVVLLVSFSLLFLFCKNKIHD